MRQVVKRMSRTFFEKLAFNNLKKNKKTYLPYLLTCIVTIAMFYMIKSLSVNPGLSDLVGANIIVYTLQLGTYVISLFAIIFLFYTNSFLIKRRQKEFGIFNILGMEKRHLAKMLGLETLYIAAISLGFGLFIGIVLDKAMYLLILKIIGVEVSLGFFLSKQAIFNTIILFGIIFLLIYLNEVRIVYVSKSIDLLHGGNVGEKEPKTKWFITLVGIVCLVAGYYLAITTKNPISSLYRFFVAVILVIVATYFLFTTGSIAFLKILKKNKKYYYQTKHFISVSGMIYRMKQNAVGLSNICILSTMVLVMVSTTTSMMVGLNDILDIRYPSDFSFYLQEDEQGVIPKIQNMTTREDEIKYTYLNLFALKNGNDYEINMNKLSATDVENVYVLMFLSLDDYNDIMGEHEKLNENEILLYSPRQKYEGQTFKLSGKEYKISEQLESFVGNGQIASNISSAYYIVLSSQDKLTALSEKTKMPLVTYYGFNSSKDDKAQEELYYKIKKELKIEVESRTQARIGALGLYGGLFFLGIFLGSLFLMATVLIIYYKQISEGYEDRERFIIMQNVGLSKAEVKEAIRSQILTVFFLPLVVAGIHVMAAFPLMSKLLSLLNMTNTTLYVLSTIGCFVAFAILYIIIYSLTAKTYYKIVSK